LYNTYYEKFENFLSACKGFLVCADWDVARERIAGAWNGGGNGYNERRKGGAGGKSDSAIFGTTCFSLFKNALFLSIKTVFPALC